MVPFDCKAQGNGAFVLTADPSIVCYVQGGPYARIRIVGTIMMLVFVVGVPLSFAAVLRRNRKGIIADQLLRQRGEGDTILTNAHIRVRHRYRKLYEVRD